VQVWDIVVNKRIKMLQGHAGRVGALAWNENVLSSGSLDGPILQRDTRTPSLVAERRLVGHQQEVSNIQFVKY
jgi:cell division cycle 20-like protein 1 (cofactor of APC complex)